jgi:hypothetical protein
MLINRTEKEENLLHGVNLKLHETKLPPGYFTSLQNWIPSKKYKIKKKRGVVDFVDGGFVTTVVHPHTCGVTPTKSLSAECGHDCPVGQYAQLTDFVYDENDLGNSGPAIRIQSDSDTDAFYGLGAVYKREATTKIVLGFWNYESLDTIPTILASYNVTLNDGDDLRLEVDQVDPYKYYVKVNGATVITYSDAGHAIDVHAPCVGVIEVTTVA